MRQLLIIFTSLLLALPRPGMAEGEVLAIVIPKGENVRAISKPELALIFWRKKLYWGSGKRIQPVNLGPENSLRRRFSQQVMESLPEDQLEYWNALYFHGTSPPYVVRSQEAMLRYIAETPGAIGYVNACVLDGRVKAVAWIAEDGSIESAAPNTNCPQ